MEIKRNDNDAWIINKHINDINLLILYARILKSNNNINPEKVEEFTNFLKQTGKYNPRWTDRKINITTALNKISELCFYMFGYKHDDKFIFSPLGNLFLEQSINSPNIKFIFTTMLWSSQFPHPHNNTSFSFNIFPFRLLFKLLLDNNLGEKLYTTEILYFLYFTKEIEENSYESLVSQIIEFRKLTLLNQVKLFLETPVGSVSNIHRFGYKKATETWWANKLHEWDYYFRKVLEQCEVIKNFDSDISVKLEQGDSGTFRNLSNNYIKLNEDLKDYILKLDKDYPYFKKPIKKEEGLLDSDFKVKVYNFLPKLLLDAINISSKKYDNILLINEIVETNNLIDITTNIEQYATHGEKHKEFEIAISQGFNCFEDIKAERVGGAGKTDIECYYIVLNRNFAVEAKATKNSFGGVQTNRLKEHRQNINGLYTILMTPKYRPLIERDIIGEDIVILKPSVFSEYLYNSIYFNDSIKFEELHNIIINNKGKDISRYVENLTLKNYSVA